MKLPEPKQKENGKWIIQVQVDGKRRSKEFETKEEALYWASGIKTGQKEAARKPSSLTVEKAIEKYIETKSSILSPSTIRGYKGIKESRIEEIKTTQLSDLTHDKV